MVQETTGNKREQFEKTILRKEKLSNFLYDIAKACFTLMVLAGVGIYYTDGLTLFVIVSVFAGLILTIILAWIANRILIY